jgi:hypothetical protein
MSLECLAILGLKNEPLYLYEPGPSKKVTADAEHDDVFGFGESESSGRGLSIRHEVSSHQWLSCVMLLRVTHFRYIDPVHDARSIGSPGRNFWITEIFGYREDAARFEVAWIIVTDGRL